MCVIVPRIGCRSYSLRRLLALDDDVDDRVQPRRAGQHGAQRALLDRDRPRVALAVQHAGDEPLPTQALGVARADAVGPSLAHFQANSVPGHGGRL
jgi:hypothetical protein